MQPQRFLLTTMNYLFKYEKMNLALALFNLLKTNSILINYLLPLLIGQIWCLIIQCIMKTQKLFPQ